MEAPMIPPDGSSFLSADDALFGWDPTPGIVSVWAARAGKAWVWQRMGDRVLCTRWTYAGARTTGWGIASAEPQDHVALCTGWHLLSCRTRRTISPAPRSGLFPWNVVPRAASPAVRSRND